MTIAPVQAVQDLPEEEVVPLRRLVREQLELSDAPSPRLAINGMVAHLPHETLVKAAEFGLVEIAKHIVRHERRRHMAPPQGSAKWDQVAAAAAERRDIFAERVWNGLVWKFMADCTKQDLVNAAEVQRVQANGILDAADRFDRLARIVKRDQTVGDLDRAKVERIFDA